MTDTALRVQMLGEFSISSSEAKLQDSSNRSRKTWLLLAYLIYNCQRITPQEELIRLLWGEESDRDNPVGALKTTMHRVRNTLNQLGASAGHDLILRRGDGYVWNTAPGLTLDIEDFERLCREGAAAADEDDRLQLYLEALTLYQGDFLPKLSSEPWVVPITAYYHNLFIGTLLETLPLLEDRGRFRDTAEQCRAALSVEPYQETIYQHLMRALLAMNDQKGAAAVYEEMSELLLANFGVMPSDESRALYRQAVKTERAQAIPSGMLLSQLREESPSSGALLCDFDFFKSIYQSKARAIERSGEAAHVGLISMTGADHTELPRRSLDRAMENLQEQVRFNLRRGDVVSQCSATQFVILLSGANFENSCMVCERIIRAFNRQYPHSPAVLHYTVQPVEPI